MTVDLTDPFLIALRLGDPRTFENINPATLRKGDCAVLAIQEGSFGAVYYLRPKPGDTLESIGGQEVLGVDILLSRNASYARGRAMIGFAVERNGLKVEVRTGRDMDGFRDHFHVFV